MLKTLVWGCVPTAAWALPVFHDPGARKLQWGIWGAPVLMQGERELKSIDSGEMWEWASQHRQHLGLLCKFGLRWEPIALSTGPLSRASQGEWGKGTPRDGKWLSNGHREGQCWGQEYSSPQIRLTWRRRTLFKESSLKYVFTEYLQSHLLGSILLIKMKTLLQKNSIRHVFQTGRNHNITYGTGESL